MNAIQLNDFANLQARNSSFVPSLTTGTQPPSQGSAVSFALPDNTVVARNALPTPYGLPWTTHQDQKEPVTTNASAPWVSVPACLAGKRPLPARGLGLVNPGGNLATPNVPGRVPVSSAPQTVRAYTY